MCINRKGKHAHKHHQDNNPAQHTHTHTQYVANRTNISPLTEIPSKWNNNFHFSKRSLFLVLVLLKEKAAKPTL